MKTYPTTKAKRPHLMLGFVLISLLTTTTYGGVTFSGPSASPTLTGSTQVVTGRTTFSDPVEYLKFDGDYTYYGYWDGATLKGTYSYAGDGDAASDFTLSTSGLTGLESGWGSTIRSFYDLSNRGYLMGDYSVPAYTYYPGGWYNAGSYSAAYASNFQTTAYSIGNYSKTSFSLASRRDSGATSADWIYTTAINTSSTSPGVSFFMDASVGPAYGTVTSAPAFYTWYRTISLPPTQKTEYSNRTNNLFSSLSSRSVAGMMFGGSSNILKLYDPASTSNPGIELNPSAGSIKIKNITLQRTGSTTRTITLPDTTGILLANTSSLDATKLTGQMPAASLPVAVSQLGSTVNLDSAEVEGNLPWSRVSNKPTTQVDYGITDGIAVARNAAGRITSAIRIEPQGDIPMLAVP